LGPMQIVAVALLVLLVLVVLSAYVVWQLSPIQQQFRRLRTMRLVRITDAPEGECVKLVGTIELVGEQLEAPITERVCTYYDCTIEGSRSGPNSPPWSPVYRKHDARDFHLVDDTGRALIRTVRSEAALLGGVLEPGRTIGLGDDDVRLAHFAQTHAEVRDALPSEVARYEENVRVAGQRIAAAGIARWVDDRAGRRLVIEAPPGESVRLSDDERVFR
jgi:hypothetical protein